MVKVKDIVVNFTVEPDALDILYEIFNTNTKTGEKREMESFKAGHVVEFVYRNQLGEVKRRLVYVTHDHGYDFGGVDLYVDDENKYRNFRPDRVLGTPVVLKSTVVDVSALNADTVLAVRKDLARTHTEVFVTKDKVVAVHREQTAKLSLDYLGHNKTWTATNLNQLRSVLQEAVRFVDSLL